MRVAPPLTSCHIIVTELAVPDEKWPRYVFNTETLGSIPALKEYLLKPEKYPIAISLGYKVKQPDNKGVFNANLIGRLSLRFDDRWGNQTFEFENVNQLVKVLKEHPVLAEAVGYQVTG